MRALLLLALLTATASAGDYEITFGSQVRALHSSSADALTGDPLAGAHLAIGHTLAIELPRHLVAWVDADATWAGATGTMFDTMSTEIFATTLTGGIHVRYQPIHNIGLSAGAAIGAQHASLTITDSFSNEAQDGAWGAVARAAGQVDLLAYDKKQFSFGLRGEFGYLFAQGIELTPKQERTDDGTLYIPMSQASLGHLDLGGAYVNISVVAQF